MGLEGSDLSDDARQETLAELTQIRDQLIALGNTRIGNEYLFGGARTLAPPFLQDGTYAGDETARRVEIDQGLVMETNHTGDESLAEALRVISDLMNELDSNGLRDGISEAVADLETAQQLSLTAQVEIGIRLGQLEDVQGRLAQRTATLSDQRDALRDADPATAILELMSNQQAMERAYEVVGRVASMSIIDYLG